MSSTDPASNPSKPTVQLTRPSTGVALFRIEAPPTNALGTALRERFLEGLESVANDFDVRAIIVTGSDNAFCSGDDLREAATRGESAQASLRQFGRLLDRLESCRVPVIAAVNGYAIGGGLELALACDIRIGNERSSFTAAGVNVGLMASVYRLPRLIGIARAKSMLLTGLPVDAATSITWGLLTALHPSEELESQALRLAERIASRAPLSVEATKRQSGRAFDRSPDESQRQAGEELAVLAASNDHREALRAFASKNTPRFSRS